jgi:hypothetical protein
MRPEARRFGFAALSRLRSGSFGLWARTSPLERPRHLGRNTRPAYTIIGICARAFRPPARAGSRDLHGARGAEADLGPGRRQAREARPGAPNADQGGADAGRLRADSSSPTPAPATPGPGRLGSGARGLSDDEVEAATASDPDGLPLDEAFWREARVIVLARSTARCAGVRISDVLARSRGDGRGYRARLKCGLNGLHQGAQARGQMAASGRPDQEVS